MLDRMKHALKSSIETSDHERFNLLIKDMYPIDIADFLSVHSDQILITFLKYTSPDLHAKVLEQANEKLQLRMIKFLDYSEVIHLFSQMSNDDVVDTLGHLPTGLRKNIINEIKEDERTSVEQLLGYSKDSAGGIMTTEFIALNRNLTISEALDKIREIGPDTEVIELIFILNNNHELVGTADLRDILSSDTNTLLSSITNETILTVYPEMDQEKVAWLVSKYDLKAIAVVNSDNKLLGIITVDDIIDVIVQEQSEDLLRLGGIGGQLKSDGTVFYYVQRRIPWLLINLGTAFLAAFTVTLFEDVISQVVALASSMSIVTGMGGNAGNQTLSVTVRSIALGELDLKKHWKKVFKEVMIGILQGAIVGSLAGIILHFKVGNPMIGLIIFLAMIGNMAVASIFGFMVPLILKRFNFDPALGSSIFLTAATDVLGFFFFLGLASLFLPWLV
jgi:magnesium transporter